MLSSIKSKIRLAKYKIWKKLFGINATHQFVEGYTAFIKDGLIVKVRRESDGFVFSEPFTGVIDDGEHTRLILKDGRITSILGSFGEHAKGCYCA